MIDRDCQHGHLARSCEICELESEVARLRPVHEAARKVVEAWIRRFSRDPAELGVAITDLRTALSAEPIPDQEFTHVPFGEYQRLHEAALDALREYDARPLRERRVGLAKMERLRAALSAERVPDRKVPSAERPFLSGDALKAALSDEDEDDWWPHVQRMREESRGQRRCVADAERKCECLPGSLAEAHCARDAAERVPTPITDEMVERAQTIYDDQYDRLRSGTLCNPMRAALAAALNGDKR